MESPLGFDGAWGTWGGAKAASRGPLYIGKGAACVLWVCLCEELPTRLRLKNLEPVLLSYATRMPHFELMRR